MKDSTTSACDAINIYYKGYMAEMGGIETMTYNLAVKYSKSKDILFLFRGSHPGQIKRMVEAGADISPYDENRTYRCKRCFVTSEKEVPDNIIADEYIRISHATPEDLMKHGFKIPSDIKKTINYGVSNYVCENTKKLAGVECEWAPNPYLEPHPRPLLKLISPQRMTWEKGLPLMQKMAEELDKHDIPFQWIVACDHLEDVVKLDNKSFVFLKSRLNIEDYINDADYLVLLSNTEGSPMAPQEALMMGVPIIVTHLPWVDDLDILDKGFFLDLDLSNLDVEEIYRKKGTFKFSYTPPKDKWGELLLDGKCERDLPKMKVCIVKATKRATERGGIFISEAGGIPTEGQEFEILDSRLKDLEDSAYGKLVEFVRFVEEKPEEPKKKTRKKKEE